MSNAETNTAIVPVTTALGLALILNAPSPAQVSYQEPATLSSISEPQAGVSCTPGSPKYEKEEFVCYNQPAIKTMVCTCAAGNYIDGTAAVSSWMCMVASVICSEGTVDNPQPAHPRAAYISRVNSKDMLDLAKGTAKQVEPSKKGSVAFKLTRSSPASRWQVSFKGAAMGVAAAALVAIVAVSVTATEKGIWLNNYKVVPLETTH
jgi:hypothetical protein